MFYRNKKTQENTNAISNGAMITPPSKPILAIVIALVSIGILAVFSASAPKSIFLGANPLKFVINQLVGLAIGIILLKFFVKYDYKKLYKYAVPFAWFVIIMLALVKFTPLGVSVNGAKRWISLGFMNLQPSEFAKFSVILSLSCAFAEDSRLFVWDKFQKYYLPIIIMVGLIILQPNLSMVLMLFIFSLIVYVMASPHFFKIVGASLIALVSGLFVVLNFGKHILQDYQWQRVEVWLHPDLDAQGASYNLLQSLYAFASGGIWGVGFGNSLAKRQWLPEGHTDFIFSVMGEEFGFLGCFFIIGLFAAFIHYGLIVSSKCTNMFGKLLSVGITLGIGIQGIINMSVTSGLIPATGVTLPFISYGGTSLIVTLGMVGILLNISRKRIRKIKSYERIRK